MHGDLIAATSLAAVSSDVGRSLRESLYMFWETLWALVLGFGLSGAVQAFVSRQQLTSRLGDHRAGTLARASLYGSASSSCSYAASAMARSLVARGADFVAAMVFMVASTNLVIELGIALLVLIGWQFVAAEFAGGVVMIVLLGALGGLWFRGHSLQQARRQASAPRGDGGAGHGGTCAGGEAGHGGTGDSHSGEVDREEAAPLPWRQRVRSLAGWSDAAGYTMSDLGMIRRELVAGFVVAGFLATVVPVHLWNDLFLHGHGFATTVENVIVGPLVALLSFVCSVGNVPLAAALWKGGIAFGGVISFVFADLITLPLLLIYRKMYGGRMALRMLAFFWLVMSVAGLVIEELFRAAGAIPRTRPTVVATDTLRWNYTTALDIVALVSFAALYLLYANRDRLGGGAGYGKDPVCGMQVQLAQAPASIRQQGRRVVFCSEHCQDRFERDPRRYLDSSGSPPVLVDE